MEVNRRLSSIDGLSKTFVKSDDCGMLQHVLTVPQAARRTRRNPETIRRWIREGKLPAHKVGAQHVIEESDLESLFSGDVLPGFSSLSREIVAILRDQRSSH